MRTKGETWVEVTLGGVTQVTADQNEQVNEIYGLYDRHVTSLRRVPGKTLATTGPGLGPIWSLHQLRFRESIGLLHQDGAGIVADLTTFPLNGAFFPPLDLGVDEVEDNSPPQYLLPDFPQPAPGEEPYPIPIDLPSIALPPPSSVTNPAPVSQGTEYALAVVPKTLAIAFVRGQAVGDIDALDFDVDITGNWPPIIIGVIQSATLVATVGLTRVQQIITAQQLHQDWRMAVISTEELEAGTHTGRIDVTVSEGRLRLARSAQIDVTVVVTGGTIQFSGSIPRFHFHQQGGVYSISQGGLSVDNPVPNLADEDFTITRLTAPTPFTTTPSEGTVLAGDSTPITVTVPRGGLTEGDHDGGLLVLNSDGGTDTESVFIRVSNFAATTPVKYTSGGWVGNDVTSVLTSFGDFGWRDPSPGANPLRDFNLYIDAGVWHARARDVTGPPVEQDVVVESMTFRESDGYPIGTADLDQFTAPGLKFHWGPDVF